MPSKQSVKPVSKTKNNKTITQGETTMKNQLTAIEANIMINHCKGARTPAQALPSVVS